MKQAATLLAILCLVLASCAKRSSVSEEVEEYDRLASVHKIYLGSFGTREGADLIKEKIRLRLIKSKRFAVVERQDQADAVLMGSAHIQESYYGSYSGSSGSGGTQYSATGVLRLVSVKNSETVWLFEYVSGHRHGSASSAVADRTVDKLLKDAQRADEKARSGGTSGTEIKQ